MQIWIAISLLLTLTYAGLMATYWQGWRRQKTSEPPKNFQAKTKITAVVPARNEAKNIQNCLRSILKNDYPPHLLQIIVVDDHSDDDTFEKASQLIENQKVEIKILRLADLLADGEKVNSHKKKAIEKAIEQATGDLIATTDADCEVPKNWLTNIAAAFDDEQVEMAAAPVLFSQEQNFFEKFQSLDFAGMMGVTAAGIHFGFQRMGNGANLAYRKSTFFEVGGFAGNDDRASGDDIFLMQKIAARRAGAVIFLKNKNSVVLTRAQPTVADFVRQRIRWGSKNSAYSEFWITAALAGVFFFCWSILLNLLFLPFFFEKIALVVAVQIFFKMIFDWLLLSSTCRFFGRRDLLRVFVGSFWLHIFYIAGVGAASIFFKKYEWKGRLLR